VTVFAALYFAYHQRFPGYDFWQSPFASAATLPPSELAKLAEGFVFAILVVQTVAIFVLTPAYLASAIVEEKERGTLELLFTTSLTSREIVLGKLAARLTHLGGILLAGLPLLALTQLWGGVDMLQLLLSFSMAGFNLLSVGSVCILCSANSRTSWGAMTASYGAVLVLFLCCCGGFPPLNSMTWIDFVQPGTPSNGLLQNGSFFFTMACLHTLIAVVAITIAVIDLRWKEQPGSADYAPALSRHVPAVQAEIRAASHAGNLPLSREPLPPIGSHPLLWKELYEGRVFSFSQTPEQSLKKNWRLRIFLVIAMGGYLLAAIHLSSPADRDEFIQFLTPLVLSTLAAFWCMRTAFRAAGAVSIERERQTLGGLLTLPVSPTDLLAAKWLGSILRGRQAGYWLGYATVITVVGGVLRPEAPLLLAISIAAHLCFWASLGLWLSVVCRTTLRARVTMSLVLLLLFAGGWFYQVTLSERSVLAYGSPDQSEKENERHDELLEIGLNPLGAWWFLSSGFADLAPGADPNVEFWGREARNLRAREFPIRLATAAIASLAYSTLAWFLWLDACRRFQPNRQGD
jgi:ABC-type transport system involved in multi-copper enzyme maturation permease subunit